MEKDLVCGMQIDEKKAAGSYDYKGKTYHFCSQACKDKFSKSPENYVK
jgi:Cu+-exporting ATPase